MILHSHSKRGAMVDWVEMFGYGAKDRGQSNSKWAFFEE